MSPADEAEYNALIALAPPAAQLAQRALWLVGVHSILFLAERRYPGYHTEAAVKAKLGI